MIYSALLVAGELVGGGDVLLYTAPDTGTVIVRDVVLRSEEAISQAQVYTVYSGSPGAGQADIHSAVGTVAGQTYHWDGRQVLRPGEQVWLHASGGTVYCRISGYTFPG